jgi:glycosyltransferase involved in cell wall biosynthesis
MDVFVLSSDFEGNPLCVMEAMAAGLPVVSTSVGGVPALLKSGKHGLLVPPGDSQSLSKGMSLLLQNHEARNMWGRAAARHARDKFDVSNMVRAYEKVYEQMLESGRPLKAQTSLPESLIPVEQGVWSRNR